MVESALLVALSVGFALLHSAENSQVYFRIQGAQKGLVAGGYQAAMEAMLVNRLGYFFTRYYIFLH